jgi:hypothetical protein
MTKLPDRGRDEREAGTLGNRRAIEEQRGLGAEIKDNVVPTPRLPGNRGLQSRSQPRACLDEQAVAISADLQLPGDSALSAVDGIEFKHGNGCAWVVAVCH